MIRTLVSDGPLSMKPAGVSDRAVADRRDHVVDGDFLGCASFRCSSQMRMLRIDVAAQANVADARDRRDVVLELVADEENLLSRSVLGPVSAVQRIG